MVTQWYQVPGGTLLVGITCRECSAQNNLIALVPTGKVQRYPLFSSVFLPHLGGKFSARCQPVIVASKLVDYFGLFSWINCGYLGGMFSAAYVRFSTYQRWTFLLGGTSSGVDVRGLLPSATFPTGIRIISGILISTSHIVEKLLAYP